LTFDRDAVTPILVLQSILSLIRKDDALIDDGSGLDILNLRFVVLG
jgi:hypothetical protein